MKTPQDFGDLGEGGREEKGGMHRKGGRGREREEREGREGRQLEEKGGVRKSKAYQSSRYYYMRLIES